MQNPLQRKKNMQPETHIQKAASEEDLDSIQVESTKVSSDRRDAIRRIGKYSAYAVPALLALTSTPAAAS